MTDGSRRDTIQTTKADPLFSHIQRPLSIPTTNNNKQEQEESLSVRILKTKTMKLTRILLCVISILSCVAAQEVAEAEAASDGAAVDAVDTIADEEVAAESSKTDENENETEPVQSHPVELPVQSGPFIDLLGPTLLSLEMTSETTATLNEHLTNDALQGKKVVGLYFSADWCGPCRQVSVLLSLN